MQIKLFLLNSLLAILLLSACSQDNFAHKDIQTQVDNTVDQVACPNFRDALFEGVQVYLMNHDMSPDLSVINADLKQHINEKFQNRLSSANIDVLTSKLSDFYSFLLKDVAEKTNTKDPHTLKQTLGALKTGDQSTDVAKQLQVVIDQKIQDIRTLLSSESVTCDQVDQDSGFLASSSQLEALRSNTPLMVLGLRKAFATAYQSCDSLNLKPMTRATAPLQGVIGPIGQDHIRQVTDKVALAASHYYVKDFKPSSQCVDVKKNTMIYDWGGKPFATSAADSTLNYWKSNPGGATPTLGIDCSGYVFSSIASAGLRLRAGKPLRAYEVDDYPARMYMDPQANGFTCLNKATLGRSSSLQAGDIVATTDHMVIVESVGRDPLAIRKYSNCANITYKDLDFVIAQSSPEQNSIGINKYQISEYLAQKLNTPIQLGFVAYAQAACRAYQAGQDVTYNDKGLSIIRHKMTTDCLQPEVKLEAESCIDSCRELYD